RAASARAEFWLHPAHSVCACFYFWLQPYTPLFRVESRVHITNIYVHGQIIYLRRLRSQSRSRWRSPKKCRQRAFANDGLPEAHTRGECVCPGAFSRHVLGKILRSISVNLAISSARWTCASSTVIVSYIDPG